MKLIIAFLDLSLAQSPSTTSDSASEEDESKTRNGLEDAAMLRLLAVDCSLIFSRTSPHDSSIIDAHVRGSHHRNHLRWGHVHSMNPCLLIPSAQQALLRRHRERSLPSYCEDSVLSLWVCGHSETSRAQSEKKLELCL
ncbi:hypothetical protein SISNIDRAFT_64803 [Sistotremastrum niveocremeum HHB9708]|uniref:Uncharacterized protein n=1 Tax=Sistotremastrum niveocremeum HHB9708 TaxID=1314777 RepID=A0A164UYH8_9AGAM|nr:hypothetical protein SISNIDRAFT_64803 [Sistotremastrum niveocremeum HHB9708]